MSAYLHLSTNRCMRTPISLEISESCFLYNRGWQKGTIRRSVDRPAVFYSAGIVRREMGNRQRETLFSGHCCVPSFQAE